MRVKNIEPRLPELGRIRTGEKAVAKNGKTYPRALRNFRVTSPHKSVVQSVAAIHGGEVTDWDNLGEVEWQVIVQADELPARLAPDGFSQRWEVWSADGLVRFCDGARATDVTPGKDDKITLTESPCDCTVGQESDCKPRTRLSVFLVGVPHVGVFRLESNSIFAAQEMLGMYELARRLAGDMAEVSLRLEHRQIKRRGQARRRFVVPVLQLIAQQTPPQIVQQATGEIARLPSGDDDKGDYWDKQVDDPGGIGGNIPPTPGGNDPLADELFGDDPPQEAPPKSATRSRQAVDLRAPPAEEADAGPDFYDPQPAITVASMELKINSAASIDEVNELLKRLVDIRRQVGESEYSRLHRLTMDRARELANGN